MEIEKPLISVIIVNWNGAKVLDHCLTALYDQTFTNFEVIIVDNGSTDGSIEATKKRWPNIHIESLDRNIGFAKANNLGVNLGKGQWIALLNNDAFPHKNWLENLILATKKYSSYSFFASRLVMVNPIDCLDGIGDVYHISGAAWRHGYGKKYQQTELVPSEVFGACAAAALYSKEIFLEVGGFDEDYFCYHEDVDLAFRLRLKGYHCLFVPEAIVNHVGSGSQGAHSDFVLYYGHRNLIWTYVKNMPNPFFWLYLPNHLLLNLFSLFWFLLNGQGKPIFQAKWDAIRGLPNILKKRKEIQKMRTIKADNIIRLMDHHLLNSYLGPRWRREKL